MVPSGSKWGVKKTGNARPSATAPTKKGAVKIGKDIAKKGKTELVIHKKDGKIKDKRSYGEDKYPPKG